MENNFHTSFNQGAWGNDTSEKDPLFCWSEMFWHQLFFSAREKINNGLRYDHFNIPPQSGSLEDTPILILR